MKDTQSITKRLTDQLNDGAIRLDCKKTETSLRELHKALERWFRFVNHNANPTDEYVDWLEDRLTTLSTMAD